MPFGWSDEPLYAEQKITNLFYAVDNALTTISKAYKLDNKLKTSNFDGFEFRPEHGYRIVMKWVPEHLKQVPDAVRSHLTGWESWGYWMIYADRIGSLGDDRHKWPVWDAHQARYDKPPKGMRTRTLPRDYLGEAFGGNNPLRRVNEDMLIAATLDKNKWRPGPHNEMPDSLKKFFK